VYTKGTAHIYNMQQLHTKYWIVAIHVPIGLLGLKKSSADKPKGQYVLGSE